MRAEIRQMVRQTRQALFRGGQRRFLLAEGEPHLGRAIGGIAVETRARYDGDSDLFD
jgi:hypothetical protein